MCFVMGAGVAGLQAIATARRLGASVSATDVRPAAKEEIKSLGASFVGREDEESRAADRRRLCQADERRLHAEAGRVVASHIAKQDIVITTALVQGRKAPTIVTAAMVESMKPGSIIVDIASDAGGNVELTVPGAGVTTANGVTILGFNNWPGRIPAASSALFARNLLTLLDHLLGQGRQGAEAAGRDDDIVKGIMLTRGGAVVHPSFPPAQAA